MDASVRVRSDESRRAERIPSRRERASALAFAEIRVDGDPDTTTVALAGEFDLATKAVLSEALEKAIAETPRTVVVDLHGVTYLDSSGIHALLTAHGAATARGHELHVTRVPRSVQRVMEICDVWTTLTG